MEKITKETTAGATEMAAVLGLTARRVQQLIQDGTFTLVSRGRVGLADSVQAYIKFISKDLPSEDDAKIDKKKRKAEADLKTHKAKIAELEADELSGKMHRSEDVAAMTEDLIYAIRGALMALPGRVAVDIAASPAEASEIVRREVYQIMRELGEYQYDPEKYEERVRERKNWDALESTDDE